MCKKTISVVDLDDKRTAYEVESFLIGVRAVDAVNADFLDSKIVIEYDETSVDLEYILDNIERAGCTPSERANGLFTRIKRAI